jgi:uncharacterized protein (DUF1015 family)
MPQVKPFRGFRYSPEKIKRLADVITQPYDQISNEMEQQYKKRSPYNFVRLILTKYAEGHDREKEYKDAKKYTDQWFKEHIFIQDQNEAVYPYWQEFSVGKKRYLRKGFMCLVRLEELGTGNIFPHERTLSKPKADRLNLLRTTQKDFEPVFLLYTDPKNTVNNLLEKECMKSPLIEVKDDRDVLHKIWSVQNPTMIKQITDSLKNSIFVIADGHHRYETAFTYKNEVKDIAEEHPAQYKLITLVNIEDYGLVVLPTHRLIKNIENFNPHAFLKKAQEFFEVTHTNRDTLATDVEKVKMHAFGFYSPKESAILKLKSPDVMKQFLADRSKEYRGLDVAILHTLLIETVLGIAPQHIEEHVRYERGTEATMKQIDSGEFQCCFLMNPTKPEQVKKVAENKERMPQKSTDFYPKLVSGLVFYDISYIK